MSLLLLFFFNILFPSIWINLDRIHFFDISLTLIVYFIEKQIETNQNYQIMCIFLSVDYKWLLSCFLGISVVVEHKLNSTPHTSQAKTFVLWVLPSCITKVSFYFAGGCRLLSKTRNKGVKETSKITHTQDEFRWKSRSNFKKGQQ